MDLAWDVILRFGFAAVDEPAAIDAGRPLLPKRFYSDWIQVAVDEAKHYRDWEQRLREMGSYYGAMHGSDSLWSSALDTMDSLCSRLCIVHMVHEARGLDVYDGMRAKLAAPGDDDYSVAMLDRNYREEITHVAAGARWLKAVVAAVTGLALPEVAGGEGAFDVAGLVASDPVLEQLRQQSASAAAEGAAAAAASVGDGGEGANPEALQGDVVGLAGTVFSRMVAERFRGKLKPPFNHAARQQAGMPREWYEVAADTH